MKERAQVSGITITIRTTPRDVTVETPDRIAG
jgi:hypothetical protein